MLYFTETGWTLPDMKEISAEFDRDYDQDEYESKIGGLIIGIKGRLATQSEEEQETWDRAMEKLSAGDNYLSVLVNVEKKKQNWVKHTLMVVVVALVLFALTALEIRFRH